MLRDLTVQNYRCFEDFQIDGLEQVNLFVGNNNSGKTSLLEAIYLLVSENKQLSLFDILIARNELKKVLEGATSFLDHIVPATHILYGHKVSFEIKEKNHHFYEAIKQVQISSSTDKEKIIKLKIEHGSIVVEFFVDKKSNFYSNDLQLDENNKILRQTDYILKQDNYPHTFLSRKKYDFNKMANIWDKIALTFKEEKVLSALRIIEPNIEKIGFSISYSHNIIRLKVKGIDIPVPINSMGEGMYIMLTIAMSLVISENGVLLVDEIEIGLHYEAQTDMWRLILETAKELNVQVFATTHSWDCIAAYQEALSQVEDQSIGKLFRLDSKYGKLRAVEYNAEDLDLAVRNSIEVR